jgi:hypothetical protein
VLSRVTLAERDLLRWLCGLSPGVHTILVVKNDSGLKSGKLIRQWSSVGEAERLSTDRLSDRHSELSEIASTAWEQRL